MKGGRGSVTVRAPAPWPRTTGSSRSSIAGIERLLDGAPEAVDLVDEEDASGLERGQEGGDVGLALERRAGSLDHRHAELGGDDVGERGLAEPGRPGEQDVVERLAAAARRLDEDPELLGDLRLVDEVVEGGRAQGPIEILIGAVGPRVVHADLGVAGTGRRRCRECGSRLRSLTRLSRRRARRRASAISSSGSSPSRPSSSCSASSGA